MSDTEETRDACCDVCGSIWHDTDDHPFAESDATEFRFPPGYDPAEADRLIGRKP